MYRIEPITASKFFSHPEVWGLFEAYAEECSIPELGRFNPRQEVYQQLEDAGVLHTLAVFHDEEIAGFSAGLLTVVPHYSKKVFTVESLFVLKEHRAGGVGLDLLTKTADRAKTLGAKVLFLSAPTGSQLSAVCKAKRFRHTNEVYTLELR